MRLKSSIKENRDYLKKKMRMDESFDVINREVVIGGREASLILVDGFIKDDIMLQVQRYLQGIDKVDINFTDQLKDLINHIPYVEVDSTPETDVIVTMVLSGNLAVIIDGIDEALLIDARTYPVRGISEPELEKVTRGARDGFTETVVFNTALVRRRIRDPNLTFSITQVGRRSRSDVVIGYIEDIANHDLVDEIKRKIDKVDTDSLEMTEKTLQEFILGRNWNPLPKARFTERPDVAAAHLLEGHVIVIVDNSPSVMILPVTLFHFTQHIQDYYQSPLVGTYFRWVRIIGMVFALFLPAIWLLMLTYQKQLPDFLKIVVPKEMNDIGIMVQLLILEFGIDLLRLASIHTPNVLASSLAIIGGLILSEFAIRAGWFIPETILCMAVSTLGMFATPSIEFSMAIRLLRLGLIILTGFFNIWGFVIGVIGIIVLFMTTETIGGLKYTWPLYPFDVKGLATLFLRKPIPEVKRRPKFLKTRDSDE